MVTTNTTPNRTELMDESHVGNKRINTLDNVSPTTTLYDIIATRTMCKRRRVRESKVKENKTKTVRIGAGNK